MNNTGKGGMYESESFGKTVSNHIILKWIFWLIYFLDSYFGRTIGSHKVTVGSQAIASGKEI